MLINPDVHADSYLPRLRRFHDARSGTCSYLIGDAQHRLAAIIDPVREDYSLYRSVLEEMEFRLAYILETHLHDDHVSAAAALRATSDAMVVCPRGSNIEGADLYVTEGARLLFGSTPIIVLATPGHTPACVTYRWLDRLFTGDALLIGDCGRCDEEGGNAGQLYDSLTRRLLPLADELLVYPGHERDECWVSCIGEERRRNPLLRGASRDEFVRRCGERHEPLPEAMADNLAANRRCGEPVSTA